MSFADDFLKKMKMVSDDDEDYDDDYDDYDDESGENDEEDADDEIISPKKKKPAKAKKSFFRRITSRPAADEDDPDDDEEYDEPDDSEEESADDYSAAADKESRSRSARPSGNVVGLKSRKTSPEVCMIMPKSFDDANTIADVLLSHKAVVLNLEGIDMTAAQRIIDFASGSCYTVGGNLQKISKKIFIVVPQDMTLSGDFDELIGDMVDLNSVNIMK